MSRFLAMETLQQTLYKNKFKTLLIAEITELLIETKAIFS